MARVGQVAPAWEGYCIAVREGRLLRLIDQLEQDGLSGRITIKGVAAGWVYLDGGRVYVAERRDRATLLNEMANGGLFSAEEWQRALRMPSGSKWRVLVADDEARLDELATFAHDYVRDALSWLAHHDHENATFAPRIAHPFGVLRTWSLDELITAEDAGRDDAAVDRETFLELLLEVSPMVRVPREVGR